MLTALVLVLASIKPAGDVSVFLSYSSADERVAGYISAELKAEGCRVWDYRDKTKPGDDWREKVEVAIDEASIVVVLISAASVKSEYTRDEWAYARLGKKRIVAIPLGSARVPMIVARFVWVVDSKNIRSLCKGVK